MLSGLVTVLVLVALVVVVVALVLRALALRARRKLEEGLRSRMDGPDPLRDTAGAWDAKAIKPGDVVQLEGRDWVVRGSLRYDEDGFTWQEHLLDGSGTDGELRRWLSVEETEGGLELLLWDRRTGVTLTPADRVELDGATYRKDESGKAGYAAEGTTGTAPAGTVRYVDYRGTGSTRLSLEQWSAEGSWEVSLGEPVATTAMQVLHR